MSTTTEDSTSIGGLLTSPPKNPIARLVAVLRSDRRAMVIAFVGSVIASLASLSQPVIVSGLVNQLRAMDMHKLAIQGGILAGVAVGTALVTAVVNTVASRAGNRTVRAFRDRSAAMALRVPAEKLVDHPSADLVARCSIDSEKLGDVFTRGPIQALGGIVLIIGSLVQMIRIDPVLCISAVALTVTTLAMIITMSKKLTGMAFARQEAQGAYVAECTRALDSVLTLRAFVADRFAVGRLRSSSERLQEQSNKAAKAMAFMAPAVTAAVQGTMLIIICIAFMRVQQGHLAVDQLVAFLMYVMMLVTPISGASETIMLMAQTLGALQRMVELRQIVDPPVIESLTGPELATALEVYEREVRAPGDPDVIEGDISFRNVSVRYAGNQGGREWALQDVSFDIARGSWVVLTGTSGSGKSTILSLMERFLVPSNGLILVDGIPLAHRDEDIYRSQVGYIEQSCPLFAGTVRDNLLLGRSGISDEDCWNMLEHVGLMGAMSSRKQGLDAPVGESAYAFSGGERQRLSIARTLLGKPRMLLLDEITSGLDVLNREQIMELIRNTMTGVTTLAAGHGRFGNQYADQVLVLDQGRLVGNGHPTEVSRNSELYRSLIAQ